MVSPKLKRRPHDTKTIRVLALVTDAYGGTGGIAQYNRDFLEALAAQDNVREVVVLPRVIARSMEPRPKSVIQIETTASSKVKYLRQVAQLTAPAEGFDLVVCAHINLLPAAWWAARRCRARLVLMVYGLEVWSPGTQAQKYMLRRCDAVVTISSITIERMRHWAPIPANRVFLIPNAVDLSAFTTGEKNEALRRRLGIGEGLLLLTLGRMDANEKAKGFDEVLQALPSLLAEFPGLTYCLAGDGTDRKRLEEKASALGVREHTVFTGYVDEHVKLELYRLSDLFVMPSRLEGFGYVFLEALAAGVPVVASSIDGSREAVRDGAWGILCDPGNPDDVIGAIRRGLTNPKMPARSELAYFSKDRFKGGVTRMMRHIFGASTPESSRGETDEAPARCG
jgi:glycosyltransferase involved in cell wall biosynthesis